MSEKDIKENEDPFWFRKTEELPKNSIKLVEDGKFPISSAEITSQNICTQKKKIENPPSETSSNLDSESDENPDDPNDQLLPFLPRETAKAIIMKFQKDEKNSDVTYAVCFRCKSRIQMDTDRMYDKEYISRTILCLKCVKTVPQLNVGKDDDEIVESNVVVIENFNVQNINVLNLHQRLDTFGCMRNFNWQANRKKVFVEYELAVHARNMFENQKKIIQEFKNDCPDMLISYARSKTIARESPFVQYFRDSKDIIHVALGNIVNEKEKEIKLCVNRVFEGIPLFFVWSMLENKLMIQMDFRKREPRKFMMAEIMFGNVLQFYVIDDREDELFLLLRLDMPPRLFRKKQSQVRINRNSIQSYWKRTTDLITPDFYGVEYLYTHELQRANIYGNERYERGKVKKPLKLEIGYNEVMFVKFKKTKKVVQMINEMNNFRKQKKVSTKKDAKERMILTNQCSFRRDNKKINNYLASLSKTNYHGLFLLEVCITERIIKRENLSLTFFSVFDKLNKSFQRRFLRELLTDGHPVWDLDKRVISYYNDVKKSLVLTNMENHIQIKKKVNLKYIFNILITPTRLIPLQPKLDIPNRVLRHFNKHVENFVRLKFVDETRKQATFEEYGTLIRHYLLSGFRCAGKRFDSLAFSASQLRSHGYWFFARTLVMTSSGRRIKSQKMLLSCAKIREWMGDFSEENHPAKVSSKMSHCFSTSYGGFTEIKENEWDMIKDNDVYFIDDEGVKKKKYTFTDGVGKIHIDLLNEVKQKLNLNKETCAIQFRFKGFKGMLVTYGKPSKKLSKKQKQKLKIKHGQYFEENYHRPVIKVLVRKSQRKFESSSSLIDVIKWSDFRPFFMGRQIVMQLEGHILQPILFKLISEAKNIDEDIRQLSFSQLLKGDLPRMVTNFFDVKELYEMKRRHPIYRSIIKLQSEMLTDLHGMMESKRVALSVLSQCYHDKPFTKVLMDTMKSGFSLKDPFINKCLKAISISLRRQLQSKARIFVKDAGCFFGIYDEYGLLQYNEIFVRPKKVNKHLRINFDFIVEGEVIVGKSPCVHPGDSRKFHAVNILEKFKHLKDEKHIKEALSWYTQLYNVVVFSGKGPRPNPDELSGSDLDGDEYFVIWDKNLIPPKDNKNFQPADYSKMKLRLFEGRITYMSIVEYYCSFIRNYNLGKVANFYYAQYAASPLGIIDEKCVRLANLHSDAVDSPKTGKKAVIDKDLRVEKYPEYMEKEFYHSYKSKNLVGVLYRIFIGHEEELGKKKKKSEHLKDKDLIIPGNEKYLKQARVVKKLYYDDLGNILQQYNVKTEADAFCESYTHYLRDYSIHVRSLKQRMKELIEGFYGFFIKSTKMKERNKKASAWYEVNYEDFDKKKLSFPFVVSNHLCMIKMRKNQEKMSYI